MGKETEWDCNSFDTNTQYMFGTRHWPSIVFFKNCKQIHCHLVYLIKFLQSEKLLFIVALLQEVCCRLHKCAQFTITRPTVKVTYAKRGKPQLKLTLFLHLNKQSTVNLFEGVKNHLKTKKTEEE